MAISIVVRPLQAHDSEWKRRSLTAAWLATSVARRGELVDVLPLPGFVALVDGAPRGLLTFAPRGHELEVVTLHVEREGLGLGRALMDAARAAAMTQGVRRLWLITTNDNCRALRFYQRWGMDLAGFHRDGVRASRAVKPALPRTSPDGIPIRHELELELILQRDFIPTQSSHSAD